MHQAPFFAAVFGVVGVTLTLTGCDVCDGSDGIDGTHLLRTQADVDAFPDGKCVRGDLAIGIRDGEGSTANANISNVDALAKLEIVEGTLSVEGNLSLTTLSLPALTFVGRR